MENLKLVKYETGRGIGTKFIDVSDEKSVQYESNKHHIYSFNDLKKSIEILTDKNLNLAQTKEKLKSLSFTAYQIDALVKVVWKI